MNFIDFCNRFDLNLDSDVFRFNSSNEIVPEEIIQQMIDLFLFELKNAQ